MMSFIPGPTSGGDLNHMIADIATQISKPTLTVVNLPSNAQPIFIKWEFNLAKVASIFEIRKVNLSFRLLAWLNSVGLGAAGICASISTVLEGVADIDEALVLTR